MANNESRWTKKDVKNSRLAVDDADYTLNANKSDGPLETSMHLFNSINKFWNTYGEEFTKFWRELPKKEKINFIKVVSPYIAKDKKDKNANRLLSDFTIESLMEHDGEGLLDMFHQRASSPDVISQDFDFCINNNIRLDTNRADEYYIQDMKYKINKDKMVGEFKKQFDDWKSKRIAMEANLYEAAYNRNIMIAQHFSLWADEYRTEVLGKKMKTVNLNVCNNCGAKSATDGSALKACARCHVVKYCCKQCQVEDWKEHKGFCNQTVQQQQAANGNNNNEPKQKIQDTVD